MRCVIPGFARNSRNIAFSHAVVLSGRSLPAGQYAVRWEAQNPALFQIFGKGEVREVVTAAGG